MQTDKADAFALYWRMLGTSNMPEREFHFAAHIGRKFRADFAWQKEMVIVEIDGGQWTAYGGRHNRDKDRERNNIAIELGWVILRYSTQTLKNDPASCIDQVIRVLNRRRK